MTRVYVERSTWSVMLNIGHISHALLVWFVLPFFASFDWRNTKGGVLTGEVLMLRWFLSLQSQSACCAVFLHSYLLLLFFFLSCFAINGDGDNTKQIPLSILPATHGYPSRSVLNMRSLSLLLWLCDWQITITGPIGSVASLLLDSFHRGLDLLLSPEPIRCLPSGGLCRFWMETNGDVTYFRCHYEDLLPYL